MRLRRWTIAFLLTAVAGMVLVSSSSAFALDPVVCTLKPDFTLPPDAPTPTVPGTVQGRKVYEGATPPSLDPGKPVLVFVHGLHGDGPGWDQNTEYYGPNNMYDIAYAAGYKTFFVDLLPSDGMAETALDSGFLLAAQLEGIANYWGVDKVNIVSHSNGAVVSNVGAIVSGRVDTLFSLAGANHGSPLADLAQTDLLGWLAELIGFNDAGTKFLQTGCMAWFRGLADAQPGNSTLSIHTAAGTGWGPFLSALEFGGLYLAGACPGVSNDGLVCVEHAKHPWARNASGVVDGEHRLLWEPGPDFELDHDNNRMGAALLDFIEIPFVASSDCYVPVFASIEPYVGVFNEATAAASGPAPAQPTGDTNVDVSRRTRPARPLTQILRGGPVEGGTAVDSFPVEEGVRSFELRILLGREATEVRLIDPTGTEHSVAPARAGNGSIFRGSYVSGTTVENPSPGTWLLELSTPATEREAYAAMVVMDDSLDLDLSEPASPRAVAGAPVTFAVDSSDPDVRTIAAIRSTPTRSTARAVGNRELVGAGAHTLSFEDAGVYNVRLTVTGISPGGFPFERTAIVSVGVAGEGGGNGTRGGPTLPPDCL